ncbi:MAG TPA: hypothetical protein VFE72_04770 [Lysobacter sp.]|nr:hypothetical protein [Lysobacter sp.]
MPQSPHPFVAAGAIALAVTACGSAAMQPNTPTGAPSGVPAHERPNETQRGAKPPVPRRNSQAVGYEITLKIANAPGPFGVVAAAMTYDVENPLCLPRLGGMSGTRVQARHSVVVELQRIAPDTYRGVAYDDMYVDEDYYGLGVCHWKLTGVGFGFKATGAPGETRFGEFLWHDDIVAERPVRAYFANLYYPRIDVADYPAEGERDLSKFRPEVRDAMFTAEFSIRKLGQ